MTNAAIPCRLCGASAAIVGRKHGAFVRREFTLAQCPACRFGFVADPCLDPEDLYDERYYSGRGADPLIDYGFELEHADRTIRIYEWRGLHRLVGTLVELTPGTRWLDFGAGTGGLVRYLRDRRACEAYAYDEGWAAARYAAAGIPQLDQPSLDEQAGTFDVVTAIEVIEHVPDPLDVLRRIRHLVRPGGVLVLTTGNAEPHRRDLAHWAYVIPEIHVSFFEPATLAYALSASGFVPASTGWQPGHADILRFKVLKNLRVRTTARWERLLPWPVLSRVADWRAQVTRQPIGWAVDARDERSALEVPLAVDAP